MRCSARSSRRDFAAPQTSTPTRVSRTCRRSSPRRSACSRRRPSTVVVARGFKAGGFNPASPARQRGLRRRAHVEPRRRREDDVGGRARDGQRAVFPDRLGGSAAQPPRSVRAGAVLHRQRRGATSSGVELELNARVHPSVDVFGAFGYTRATFKGSISSGIDVGGNTIPNTPDYTATFGAQVSRPRAPDRRSTDGRRRTFYGAFEYDDLNLAAAGRVFAGQLPRPARGGVSVRRRHGSGTRSTRTTFRSRSPTCQLAPSGFIGEMGGRGRLA